MKEFISPSAVRLATGLVDHTRLGPRTMAMLDGDILFTSSCSVTFEREGGREREREREREGERERVSVCVCVRARALCVYACELAYSDKECDEVVKNGMIDGRKSLNHFTHSRNPLFLWQSWRQGNNNNYMYTCTYMYVYSVTEESIIQCTVHMYM